MPRHRANGAAIALAATSVALLLVRLVAATRIGFGDSEALYASYALHPQAAYLDHPGMVAVLARLLGGGGAPSPAVAHAVTAVLATALPWEMALACRAAGAVWPRAFGVALVVAWTPEIAIGLFAMTPDLLLAIAWTGALGLAAHGLRSPPGGWRATFSLAGAGLLAGVATASKVSGLSLLAALALAYGSRAARGHARTLAPWAGLGAGLLVLVPVARFEASSGWPMLLHRLVETQGGAGVSPRNIGALLGGQLAYLSPLVAVLAVYAARDAWRGRGDAVGQLLLASFAVPLATLVPLCLWSRVAEPHWVAPALLALGPAAACAPSTPPRRLLAAAVGISASLVIAVHAWVLVPSAIRLAPASYEPALDLANELQGWPAVVDAVRAEASALGPPGNVDVVGPHWVICAQLEAALQGRWRVGCDTPIRDDFDDWWPRARWRTADAIVWVSDARFEAWPGVPSYASLLSSYSVAHERQIRIERGGLTVRTFRITVLVQGGAA